MYTMDGNPPKGVVPLEALAKAPFSKAVSNIPVRGEPSALERSVVAVLFRPKLTVRRYW